MKHATASAVALVSLMSLLLIPAARAGGPLLVGGPGLGTSGQAFTWDTAKPIQYRVDSGPMAKNPSGTIVVTNATGLTRVQALFNTWQSAPNATLAFQNAGSIQVSGAFQGGDVVTAADFNAVQGSCNSGVQSPIIFDADGSIVEDLGLPQDVIGFASPCAVDGQSGHFVTGLALMNGRFQDGVSSSSNYEITAAQFDEAITHELGHFLGLDHSQINVSLLDSYPPCDADQLAGLPLMFPIMSCQARVSAGLPMLAQDDRAWIAKLYPSASFSSSYGTISGTVLFSDGITQAQGVNVIARQVDDPSTPEDESKRIAISVVSGFRFTGNPGQEVSGDNTGGDRTGSRDPKLIGYFEIPVPPGTYTVEVESVNPSFQGGSSVGPLGSPITIPGPPEFWDSAESAFDDTTAKGTISVGAGQTVNDINIILNGTPPRFDDLEDGGAFLLPSAPSPAMTSENGALA